MNPYLYQTISLQTSSEFKDRGSKFLGYSFSITNVDGFKTHLKTIKELHPKATHHCFAYRLGLDKNNYRASDDGEPSGSAGKPILAAIDSLNVTNALIIVVRYYGGTMLGVPGLINAYKTTAKLCLENNQIIQQELTQDFCLEFEYNLTATVTQAVKKLNGTIQSTENLLFCKIIVQIPQSNAQNAMEMFKKIHNLAFEKR